MRTIWIPILLLLISTISTEAFGEIQSSTTDYLQLIQERVAQKIIYPESARDEGLRGTVKIKALILADGELEEVVVAESCGHRILDELAMIAVGEAAPYPPFPQQMKELEVLWVDLFIVYEARPLAAEEVLAEVREPEASEQEIISSYVRLVRERLNQAISHLKIKKELKGRVKLRILISADGELEEVVVAESSGEKAADETAVIVVDSAAPYPPFPPGLKLSQLWIELPVVYTPSVGIEDLIGIGLANHRPAQIAKEQIELNRLRVLLARRELFPKLWAEWEETEGEVVVEPYRSRSYGLRFEQPIYDGKKNLYTIRQEELGLKSAERNYEKIKADLAFEVKKAYYELARAQLNLENMKEVTEKGREDLELTKKLYDLGLTTLVEFLDVQSGYGRAGYLLTSTQSDLSLARLSLQQALNVEALEEIDFDPSLLFEVKDLKIDLEECLELAQSARLEIQIMEMVSSSSMYQEWIAKRENWPKVSLTGFWGSSGEAYELEPLELIDEWSLLLKVGWSWGGSSMETSAQQEKTAGEEIVELIRKIEATKFSAKFGLLDNLEYFSKRKEARVTHDQALNELEEIKEKAAFEVKEAYFNYQKALAHIDLTSDSVNFREKELAIRQTKRDLGEPEVKTSDLLEARIELAQERASYFRALTNYHLALANLNKAIGISGYYR